MLIDYVRVMSFEVICREERHGRNYHYYIDIIYSIFLVLYRCFSHACRDHSSAITLLTPTNKMLQQFVSIFIVFSLFHRPKPLVSPFLFLILH